MKRTCLLLVLIALLTLVAAPLRADQADATDSATAATETAPARPAEDPAAEPDADPSPDLDLFVPEADQKLYCSEYCGNGVWVSCSCPGSGTCTSESGWYGWVECLCNGATDDEEVCPGYPGPGCQNPPSKCIDGASCTPECGCAEGTCMGNGTCNCLA